MASHDAPERPRLEPASARRASHVSRRLQPWAVVFGVIFGAYVARTLQSPLGLDDDNDTLLFWVFFLVVMAALAGAFLAAALLVRGVRRR
jgi:hypothetical protein